MKVEQTIEQTISKGYSLRQIKKAINRGVITVLKRSSKKSLMVIDANSSFFTHLSKPNPSMEGQ